MSTETAPPSPAVQAAIAELRPLIEGQTVVVGLSGGVDSAASAWLCQQAGAQVVGLFMKNWEETLPDGRCTSEADSADASRVCDALGIPFHAVNFAREYRERVFARFVKEYEQGLTPNPDILCNREIKFDVFQAHAEVLGGDWLATGHYCQLVREGAEVRLARGRDPGKDQSYFLHAVPAEKLQRVLFPVGGLLKSEVRECARLAGLAVHDKRDSTGICFIGERDFRPFLSRYVAAQPGPMKTLDGETVGRHTGSAFFTLGQRKGLGLGGQGDPWFVVDKDPARNILYVERGTDSPRLYSDWLEADEVTWVSGQAPAAGTALTAKIRYRQADQACRIQAPAAQSPGLRVEFAEPQRAVTPGQSVVFYDGDVCLGGAVIRVRGPSRGPATDPAYPAQSGS